MGPPHSALLLLLNDNLNGREQAQPFVWPQAVVLDQPVRQLFVEQVTIFSQQVLVIIHTLRLDSPIKTRAHGIHFRRLGIGPQGGDITAVQACIQGTLELTPASGDDLRRVERGQPETAFKALPGHPAVEPGHGPGHRLITHRVNRDQAIAFHPTRTSFYGIEPHAFTPLLRPIAFGTVGPGPTPRESEWRASGHTTYGDSYPNTPAP